MLPTTTTTINGQQVTYSNTTQEQQILNKMAAQIDAISSGQISAVWNAASAPPTEVGKPLTTNPTGKVLGVTYGVGDFLTNNAPEVTTVNGHGWILRGWLCVKAGNTGTANPPVFEPMYSVTTPF
ncbi:hypothetical protein AB4Y36_03455 [Paraburkholderia sp. BR10936]|uniref:hypothetical protein n=1 Tax=Paraburkholderia sp. BR10936 TaxID=3236993 RepID=UPI0034D2352D